MHKKKVLKVYYLREIKSELSDHSIVDLKSLQTKIVLFNLYRTFTLTFETQQLNYLCFTFLSVTT